MTELYDDTDLRVAFHDFAGVTHPYVRPPGADLAQRDARARIRTRRLVVVCAAALAVLVPAALVALAQVGGSSSMPPPPATEAPVTPTAPTRSSTPTATLTATPTTTASPVGQATDGPGDLLNATLSLSWSDAYANEICGGTVTIVEGTSRAIILSTMHLDVDNDGTNEIVANIFCQVGQGGPMQLVAVEPGPPPSVIGAVLKTADTGAEGRLVDPDGPGVAVIHSYAGLSDGSIRVEVSDRMTCCGIPVEWAVRQERTFRWTGSAFEQIDGPTTFAADRSVADVEVSVPTVALGQPVDGFRSGTMSITVRNKGPQAVADVSFVAWYNWSFAEPTGGDWGRCDPTWQTFAVCSIGDVAAGQSVTLTLPVRRGSSQEQIEQPAITSYPGRVEVRAGDVRYPFVEFYVSLA